MMAENQVMVTLAGLAEMQAPKAENFLQVPSTQAAMDHMMNSAKDKEEGAEQVVVALAVDVMADGRSHHPRLVTISSHRPGGN